MVKKIFLSALLTLSLFSSTIYAIQSDLLDEMGFKSAHNQGITGMGQTILLFDEAPNIPHPSYEGTSFQWLETSHDSSNKRSPHGIGVRGIIQSQRGEHTGDRGLAPHVTIVASDRQGTGPSLLKLLQTPGRIVNCSCEMGFTDIHIDQVKDAIVKNDSILVIAAGNFGEFLSQNPEADWLLDPEIRDHVLFVGNALSFKQPKTKKKFFHKNKKETNPEYHICEEYFVDFVQKNLHQDYYEGFFKLIKFNRLSFDELRKIFASINKLVQAIGLTWQNLSDVNYHKMVSERSDKKTGGIGIFGMLNVYEKFMMTYTDNKHKNEFYQKIVQNRQAHDELKAISAIFQQTELDSVGLLITLAQEINLTHIKDDMTYYFMNPFSNKKGLSPFPMICALGSNIQHPAINFDYSKSESTTGYEKGSGTSYAAPIISSALALALQVNSNITAKQLIKCLLSTAHQPTYEGVHHFDAGVLNLPAFLTRVEKYKMQNIQLKNLSNMPPLVSLQ